MAKVRERARKYIREREDDRVHSEIPTQNGGSTYKIQGTNTNQRGYWRRLYKAIRRTIEYIYTRKNNGDAIVESFGLGEDVGAANWRAKD